MQSVQRLWGEKFIKVWYNKSHAAGRFPYNDKNEEMHMANGIIFLVGALIMFAPLPHTAQRHVKHDQRAHQKNNHIQHRFPSFFRNRRAVPGRIVYCTIICPKKRPTAAIQSAPTLPQKFVE